MLIYRYLEDLAVATGYVDKVKLIEGLTIAAKCFSEIMFFYLSGNISYFSSQSVIQCV